MKVSPKQCPKRFATAVAAILVLSLTSRASAAQKFPYSKRTRSYSAWTPANRGDINTVGMSGATVAASSSISAAEANPASFAMELGSVSAQLNKSSVEDEQIERSGDSIQTTQWGLAVSPPPWGFSLASYVPINESGEYASPITGRNLKSEVSLREYRLTFARHLVDTGLALGASLELLHAVRELGANAFNSTAWSYQIGALYRLPHHLVLGGTYAPQTTVDPASDPESQFELPGFNQPLIRPAQVTVGLGWLPNRFFKAGASLALVGSTENTALMADQNVTVGEHPTWVPRLGASYVFMEFQNFKLEAAAGSYYEVSRLSDQSNRLHLTFGLEANPWFFNTGVGFDLSSAYKNVMLSIGVDIVRTLRTFNLIPTDPVPAADSTLPSPTAISADGLPEGLTHGEKKQYQGPSVEQVGKIIQELPKNVQKKFSGQPTSIELEKRRKRGAGRKRRRVLKEPSAN